jgi:hypothetical protein
MFEILTFVILFLMVLFLIVALSPIVARAELDSFKSQRIGCRWIKIVETPDIRFTCDITEKYCTIKDCPICQEKKDD